MKLDDLKARLPVAWIDKDGTLHNSAAQPILFLEVAGHTGDGQLLDRSIVWEGRDLDEGCRQWLARKNATDRITLNGYYMGELVGDRDLEWRYGERQASAQCPICWRATPHHHTPEEEAEQREWIAENARRNDARWAEIEAKVDALEAKYPPRTPLYTLEAATAITDLEALVGELGEALAECADDLEAEVRDRWFMGGTEVHPALEHKFERDMAPVNKARATLAKLEKARGKDQTDG